MTSSAQESSRGGTRIRPLGQTLATRRSFIRQGTVVVFAYGSLSSFLAACARDTGAEGPEGTLARAQTQGFIRIAFANEPPYAQISSDGVSVTGAAPDVARAVMVELGVAEVAGVVTDWSAMIPALQAGRFDLITAGLSINPERCQEILFSEPDVCFTEVLVVQSGNPLGFSSVADLAGAQELKLAVIPGNAEEALALAAGVDSSKFVPVADARSMMEVFMGGRANAFMAPDLTAADLLATTEGGTEAAEIVTDLPDAPVKCAGAGFRKDDEEFRDSYNAALQQLKDDGRFEEILTPYGLPVQAALTNSTEALCSADA